MTVSIENLSFAYGRFEVLRDISARAEAGHITAVIGPNAAGKSTLLRCAIGSLRPAQGQALIDGQAAHRLSPNRLARVAAYISQRSTVSAAFSVRQVIELGRFALSADAGRASDAIDRLELRDIVDRPFTALSVGQQQRVMLARAVAQLEPRGNLILDEPVSSMDLRHVQRCMLMLRQLADDGATVVLAMHDLSLAASMADHAWILNSGRLVSQGPVQDVLTAARLKDVFGVAFQWLDGPWGAPVLVAEQPARGTATTMRPS